VLSALKKSRHFLASAPESLSHWAAHARLERLRGRLEEARKVYQTVLASPTSTGSRLSAGPLWWDWAEMEWLAGDSDAATRVILRAAEVEGLGGLAILRGKRALEATAREIPDTLWKVREAWTRLGVLLELLTGNSSPSFLTAPLEAGTVVQESMAVASLGMLYHHISTLRSPTRPAVLRGRLEKAVELFPNNTILLGMFLETQKGQGVWGRVRKLADNVSISDDVGQEKGISRRAAEVWLGGWEKGRWFWEVERIRGGLTAAIESERCVCPGAIRKADSKTLSVAHEGAQFCGVFCWSWRYGQVTWRGQKMYCCKPLESALWSKVRLFSHIYVTLLSVQFYCIKIYICKRLIGYDPPSLLMN
jgi:hypothetical protein